MKLIHIPLSRSTVQHKAFIASARSAVALGLVARSGIIPRHSQRAGDFPPGLRYRRVALAMDHRCNPKELPQKLSGHNPRVFELPFLREVTSANAPSEMYRYAAVPKSNRPVSPEVKHPSTPKIALTELGWTDPVAAYSKHAKEDWLSS